MCHKVSSQEVFRLNGPTLLFLDLTGGLACWKDVSFLRVTSCEHFVILPTQKRVTGSDSDTQPTHDDLLIVTHS